MRNRGDDADSEALKTTTHSNPTINGKPMAVTGDFIDAKIAKGTVISAGGYQFTSNGNGTFEGPDGTVSLKFDKMSKEITVKTATKEQAEADKDIA